jgi:outer membrane murein-binding lipoprotein Lpp
MDELARRNDAGEAAASAGGMLSMVVRYSIILFQLTAAGARLAGLSERVRSTYRYVEGCSSDVDRLAERMAGLHVDVDTVAEHHNAAGVMRGVLDDADAMAASLEDLSALFTATAAAHQADYAQVAAAAQSMSVPMADAEFYSNR